MAGDAYAADGQQLRALGAAALVGVRAARVEGAARRRIEWVGHLALHGRACAARVVHLEAKIGLPEHTLGILPGWGGCTRLTARLGAAKAFAALTQPRPAGSAREAVKVVPTVFALAPNSVSKCVVPIVAIL